jgi:hypothetical protein
MAATFSSATRSNARSVDPESSVGSEAFRSEGLTDVSRTSVLRPTPQIPPVRRRAAGAVVAAAVAAITLMLMAAVLHTQLAERQFKIDNLNRSVRSEQARFAVLRSERAELRSPTRLAEAARAVGMNPAQPTEFLEIEPMELARVIAAGGALPEASQTVSEANPLGQFLTVKILRNEP